MINGNKDIVHTYNSGINLKYNSYNSTQVFVLTCAGNSLTKILAVIKLTSFES